MNENNEQGTTTATEGKSKKTKGKARQVFPTLAEAKANQPAGKSAKERVIEVLKDGKSVGFVWAGNAGKGLLAVARRDGYTAKIAEPKGAGPLTKEKIGSALSAMTDEDRAILIAQYVPIPAPAPVDSPAPGKGKGKAAAGRKK